MAGDEPSIQGSPITPTGLQPRRCNAPRSSSREVGWPLGRCLPWISKAYLVDQNIIVGFSAGLRWDQLACLAVTLEGLEVGGEFRKTRGASEARVCLSGLHFTGDRALGIVDQRQSGLWSLGPGQKGCLETFPQHVGSPSRPSRLWNAWSLCLGSRYGPAGSGPRRKPELALRYGLRLGYGLPLA